MLVGLILHEKVKPRRSLTAWKERAKDLLPPPVLAGAEKTFGVARSFGVEPEGIIDKMIHPNNTGDSGMSGLTAKGGGLGFGRQEFLNRPVDGLPRYTNQNAAGNGAT